MQKVPPRSNGRIFSRVAVAAPALSVIEGWLDERGTMGDDDYHTQLGSLVDEADRAKDAADERALAKDAPGLRSTSPVLERRRDALKGFTVGLPRCGTRSIRSTHWSHSWLWQRRRLPEQEKGPH